MITSKFTKSQKILIITIDGELTVDDLSALAKKLDKHINQADEVPNLILHITGTPHWKGFKALKKHFRLVKKHHKLIKKVAVVSDQRAFQILPYLMDHFIAAKVRYFPERSMEDAKVWAEAAEDHPGAFEILDGLPGDVIGIRARGIITAQDYTERLVPLVEKKLKKHDHLKLLVVLDDAFTSYSEAAAWDDMRFGFSHIGDFAKLAVVTDLGWLRQSAKFFGPLVRAQVHVFEVRDLEEAKSWIKR